MVDGQLDGFDNLDFTDGLILKYIHEMDMVDWKSKQPTEFVQELSSLCYDVR